MNKKNINIIILLHLLLFVYSFTGICSKLAAKENFLSMKFCLLYGCILFLLALYALGWQQIIKRLPLTTAFANKAVTVVWGLVWGLIFFHENVSVGKIIGAILVIIGVVMYATADDNKTVKDDKEEYE